ncbi:TetR/AcrR family transcriptional regulator [Agromyces aurantiacus]|uniref:TetR/AcrR family transcriptional regulator n=1 Tax=Agromyces aurantiacus TaxID=165814 RepID=A0ABV9R447_9MICO|nr:TetR/AcrR family transcriptional regulator [Agromyces aurantiacus]MBM7502963.1 AcrR family transcriptional regulator [Agromyces aurantiacus]
MTTVTTAAPGRPRDAAIDAEVLDAALAELAAKGFAGFSIASVAAAAGTTRPAVYRRWRDKTALVVDAVARLAEVDPPSVTGDAFDDLVAELAHFRHCIGEAAALPLAGLMLGDDVEPAVRAQYLERIVAPRRARLRAILRAAVDSGALDADADLAVAGTFLTGSWYSMALAGIAPPDDWPERVARLVWRACGGRPPGAAE